MKDIILTGPKHSGKTSAGKALAKLCSCDFIDLDDLILQRTGKSPRQLFGEGQAVFQKAEVDAVTALFSGDGASGKSANRDGGDDASRNGTVGDGASRDGADGVSGYGGDVASGDGEDGSRRNVIGTGSIEEGLRVIAAGGGIIDNEEAVAVLKKSGAMTIYLNISTDSAWNRIAANGELPPFLRTENPRETHRVLHERRAAAYLQFADVIIEADGKSPQEIAREIVNLLN